MEVREEAGWQIVTLPENMDRDSMKELNNYIDKVIVDGIKLIKLDMSRVNSIDSMQVGILVRMLKVTKDLSGELILVNVNQDVMLTLQNTSLDKLFKFETSESEGNIETESMAVDVGITLDVQQLEHAVILRVDGMICNPQEADKLKDKALEVVGDKSRLVMDFNNLMFIDSMGIAEVINVHRHLAKENKALVIFGMNDIIVDLIYNLGLNHIIPIKETEAEALAD